MLGGTFDQAKDYAPLACLVMVLLFARSGLYRDRAQRPGFAKVISSLFEVALVVLIYAEIEGQAFKSYYIFYGTLFFALVYVSCRAGCSSASAGSSCAPPATAAARCSWAPARTSRPCRTPSAAAR